MVKIAYACSWWRPASTTWSGSAAGLLNALVARSDVDLTRVDAQHGPATAAALVGLGRIEGYGNWKFSRTSRALTDARVRRRLRNLDVDAVIGVGDIETTTERPTYLFQDANFSVLKAHSSLLSERAGEHIRFPRGRLDALIEEQQRNYAAAEGILSFSSWFADWLVEHDSVPREKVHVVGGGLSALPAQRDTASRDSGGTRVLFIGRDFFRKGGDLVVRAIELLHANGSSDFTLTVVGPTSWPLPGPVPCWVDFRGEVPAAHVAALWAEHDIFALPTWYEPYGLVFLEARAAGVPALGRDGYCMPELVPPSAGRLISPEGGADAVAESLLALSKDSRVFASAAAQADQVRAEWTWDTTANHVMQAIRGGID